MNRCSNLQSAHRARSARIGQPGAPPIAFSRSGRYATGPPDPADCGDLRSSSSPARVRRVVRPPARRCRCAPRGVPPQEVHNRFIQLAARRPAVPAERDRRWILGSCGRRRCEVDHPLGARGHRRRRASQVKAGLHACPGLVLHAALLHAAAGVNNAEVRTPGVRRSPVATTTKSGWPWHVGWDARPAGCRHRRVHTCCFARLARGHHRSLPVGMFRDHSRHERGFISGGARSACRSAATCTVRRLGARGRPRRCSSGRRSWPHARRAGGSSACRSSPSAARSRRAITTAGGEQARA